MNYYQVNLQYQNTRDKETSPTSIPVSQSIGFTYQNMHGKLDSKESLWCQLAQSKTCLSLGNVPRWLVLTKVQPPRTCLNLSDVSAQNNFIQLGLRTRQILCWIRAGQSNLLQLNKVHLAHTSTASSWHHHQSTTICRVRNQACKSLYQFDASLWVKVKCKHV